MARETAAPPQARKCGMDCAPAGPAGPPDTRLLGGYRAAAAAPEAGPEPRPHLAHQPLPVALGPIAVHVPSCVRGPATQTPPFSSGSCCRRHPSQRSRERAGHHRASAPPPPPARLPPRQPPRRKGRRSRAPTTALLQYSPGPASAAAPRGPQVTSPVS